MPDPLIEEVLAARPEPPGHGCRTPNIRRRDRNRVWVCRCSQAWVARYNPGMTSGWWEWEMWNPWK